MYPGKLTEQHPTIAAAMECMVKGEKVRAHDTQWAETMRVELQRHPMDSVSFDLIFIAAWEALTGTQGLFLERTSQAFRYFGINDQVRLFIGSLWAAAFRHWPVEAQEEFLERLQNLKRNELGLALAFLPPVFREMRPAPAFLSRWIESIRKASGGQYLHPMPECLKVYATIKHQDALQLIELWARAQLDDATRTIAAQTLHWVRESAGSAQSEARLSLETIENSLGAIGKSSCRALLLESWAFSAGSPALDLNRTKNLRDLFDSDSLEEVRAWCFLLAQVIATAPEKWPWAFVELQRLVNHVIAAPAKYWVGIAAMNGWKMGEPGTRVEREEWELLFFQLAPIGEMDGALWQQLEHFLVDAFRIDPIRAQRILVRVAETSGETWDALLEGNRDAFLWLCQSLQAAAYAESTITALCLSDARSARRVGLRLFERCGLTNLHAADIARANPVKIERILLESTIRIGEYDHLALLHLNLAQRVDQINGPLAEWFYEEVLTQALNTNQYRQTILGSTNEQAKLRTLVKEAERQIDESGKAGNSPALKMQIPGFKRAEILSMRRLGQMVSDSVDKNSIFAQLVTTVPLLYGKTWRMQDKEGLLGAASELKRSEISTEVPRLEFMTPEAMRQRRLLAVKRIEILDQTELKV